MRLCIPIMNGKYGTAQIHVILYTKRIYILVTGAQYPKITVVSLSAQRTCMARH